MSTTPWDALHDINVLRMLTIKTSIRLPWRMANPRMALIHDSYRAKLLNHQQDTCERMSQQNKFPPYRNLEKQIRPFGGQFRSARGTIEQVTPALKRTIHASTKATLPRNS